jgi:hypothetical protein
MRGREGVFVCVCDREREKRRCVRACVFESETYCGEISKW